MRKDIEYMLVETTGLENVLFSSNKLSSVAKFCKMNYSYVSKHRIEGFNFEGKPVKIIAIDLNENYGE